MIAELLKKMPLANGRAVVEKRFALNGDIITVIHKNFTKALEQTRTIAKNFRGNTRLGTAYNLWLFLRTEINYKRDPDTSQDIRLPSRFLRDRTGDCKTYSLFAAAVLANLGLPVKFRYACYLGNGIPGHVYVVTQDENGNEIIVDGVYHLFNEEKKYTSKKDYTMKVQTLGSINGVSGINGFFGDVAKFVTTNAKSVVKDVKKAATVTTKFVSTNVKSAVKDIKTVAAKVKAGAALTLLAVPRLAFLGILELNGHGFATKLAKADQGKLKSLWTKLGGDYSKLTPAINRGKAKKSILGHEDYVRIDGIGELATLATAAAASAPIIAVIVAFLKTSGLSDSAIEKISTLAQSEFTKLTGGNAVDIAKEALEESEAGLKPEGAGFTITPTVLLLAGGTLVTLFLLTKPKSKNN